MDSGMRRSEAVAQVATDAGGVAPELYALVVKR